MSRVVFSIIPHGWELRLAQRIQPQKVLMSFFYLGKMGDDRIESLFKTLGKMKMESLIDSGVFSLRVKYGKGIFALGSSYERFHPEEKENIIRHYRNHIDDFDEFKDKYISFLKRHGDKLNWAIDLDVDQFLGIDTAERYYEDIVKVFPSQRLLRVWHSTYRTFEDWKKWCDSGLYTYLAIEGAGSHGYDPHFYDPFVSYAHSKGIKVHILAMTSVDLLNQVPFDTGDSTTYQVGARYGQIQTPWGFIYVSEVREGLKSKTNYARFSPDEQEKVRKLLSENGFDFDKMLESNCEKISMAGIERSAWNMYFQENYFGAIKASKIDTQLSLF